VRAIDLYETLLNTLGEDETVKALRAVVEDVALDPKKLYRQYPNLVNTILSVGELSDTAQSSWLNTMIRVAKGLTA
jgi:hypothetical protein